jgi:molecular chaperone DnaK (HSP70)
VEAGFNEFGDGVNDCRRIGYILEEKLNLSNDWSKLERSQFKHEVKSLFQRTWKILEEHYMEAIAAIAVELSKVELLPAETVLSIIKANLDPESSEPKTARGLGAIKRPKFQ